MAKIVCIGDSMTYGYEIPRSDIWTTLAQRETGVLLINSGVNGALTGEMLTWFPEEMTMHRPDAVLLMGGANDIAFYGDAGAAFINLRTMAERADDMGVRPLLGIPLPFCPPGDDWGDVTEFVESGRKYEKLADWLGELAKEKNWATVDFRAGAAAYLREKQLPPESIYMDGVHINHRGHRVFADVLVTALKELGYAGGEK